ncbi:MAG: dephospho-CoA kinase [Propionibacteriaceae bacterium]|nr:dephospho-CoA kinase [Propionibacteriaceae bacterium]
MLRIGLTGPIAAGKSVAAAQLRRLGVRVIDHDELARAVLAPGTPGQAEAVAAFGPHVVAADGTTDRAALARLVFADAAARARLERIVHPRVRARSDELDAACRAAGEPLVVHDVPLLVETGQAGSFDAVLVVDAPDDVRLRRLTEVRGMAPDEARRRLAAQAPRADRLAAATVVFDGGGPPAALEGQVARWLAGLGETVGGAL